jgi:hypothetical protein
MFAILRSMMTTYRKANTTPKLTARMTQSKNRLVVNSTTIYHLSKKIRLDYLNLPKMPLILNS